MSAAKPCQPVRQADRAKIKERIDTINGLVHALSNRFTPVTALFLLLHGDERNRETMEEINKAVDRIIDYFDKFNLVRGLELRENIEIRSRVNEIFSGTVNRFSALNPEAVLSISDDLDRKINMYPSIFDTVLKEVLTNAFEAIEKGGSVTLSLEKMTREQADWLLIAVTDNGRGMTQDIQRKMFLPFFSTKPDADAHENGLSLALVQCSIFILQGEIEVETQEGRGTRVRLWIPLKGASRISL